MIGSTTTFTNPALAGNGVSLSDKYRTAKLQRKPLSRDARNPKNVIRGREFAEEGMMSKLRNVCSFALPCKWSGKSWHSSCRCCSRGVSSRRVGLQGRKYIQGICVNLCSLVVGPRPVHSNTTWAFWSFAISILLRNTFCNSPLAACQNNRKDFEEGVREQ